MVKKFIIIESVKLLDIVSNLLSFSANPSSNILNYRL